MSEAHLLKARLLLQHDNYKEAEESVKMALASDPDNSEALCILAICLSHREEHKSALKISEDAVASSPDAYYPLYIRACVAYDAGNLKIAESSIREALNHDPANADAHGILASILWRRKKWEEALGEVETGLRYDPEHVTCRNIRARILSQIGRKDEADNMARDNLRNRPQSSSAHASLGWVCMEQGNHREAIRHFRESLRLRPDNESARIGVMHAIKATNILYAGFFAYMRWLGRLPGWVQIGFFIGIWFVYRVMHTIASSNPQTAKYAYWAIILYFGFIYTSWTAEALFNVMLFLHPLGRHALTRYEKGVTWAMLASLVIGIIMVSGYFILNQDALGLGGIAFFALGIPLASLYKADNPRNRWIFGLQTVCLGIASLAIVGASYVRPDVLSQIYNVFLIIVILTWVNSSLLARER